MSTAQPMPTWQRVDNYHATGRSKPTARQRRRIIHKDNRLRKIEILARVARHIREGL